MAKKDGPVKLPRKLAGVKVPKSVRKGAVADFLGSSAGQKLIAEVIAAAATALIVKKQSEPGSPTRKTARRAKRKIGEVAESVGEAAPVASIGAGTLAFAFSEAGRAFREALHGHDRSAPEPPDADWPADFEEPAGKPAKAEPTVKPH